MGLSPSGDKVGTEQKLIGMMVDIFVCLRQLFSRDQYYEGAGDCIDSSRRFSWLRLERNMSDDMIKASAKNGGAATQIGSPAASLDSLATVRTAKCFTRRTRRCKTKASLQEIPRHNQLSDESVKITVTCIGTLNGLQIT